MELQHNARVPLLPLALPVREKHGAVFVFRANRSKGFTLIEIVITIVLLTILSAIAAVIILQGVRGYMSEESRSDVHYQTRLAMERMAREIRTARQPDDVGTTVIGTITGNPAASFIFTDVTGTDIAYSLSGTTLKRTAGGAAETLAMGVTTLQFSHYDNAGAPTTSAPAVWIIDVFMTDLRGNDSLQVRTRVHPRNF